MRPEDEGTGGPSTGGPNSHRGVSRRTSVWPQRASSQPAGPRATITREKVELLGELSKTYAHEINNVLAAIAGFASVLQHEFDEASPLSEDVNGILQACKKGVDLTHDMMSFGAASVRSRQPVSINEMARLVRSLLMRSISPAIEVELRLANDAGSVEANPIQLRQALLNVGLNAAEAIANKGKVIISTESVRLDKGPPDAADCPPGLYVRVQVSDTGHGMDAITLERCFEPFFTTKPTRGGLGLSIVGTTVEQHGGSVQIFSKKSLGTTVTIYLPQAGSAGEIELEPTPPPGQASQKGVILVVDDDRLVLRAVRRLVETLGFEVITAASGTDAVKRYARRRRDVDLVLLDLVMPDRDGREVLRDLRKIDPDAPVVIASGYPMDDLGPEIEKMGVRGVIRKPYTLDQLETTLKELLGKR